MESEKENNNNNNNNNNNSPDTNTSDSESLRVPKIKQEPDDEFKDYAKDMMKEMLGWYGYDTKVDNRETETPKEERYQLAPVDDGSSGVGELPRDCASTDGSETDHMSRDSDNGRQNLLDSTSPIPIIICAWCQKNGSKLFTLKTASGNKAFCSELCFNQCRRASFKKNKICDFCKHVRPTVNYVEFQEGEVQLQFCSKKCLGQYKMKIFSETIRNANKGGDVPQSLSREMTDRQILITPDLWLMDGKDRNSTDNDKRTNSEDSGEQSRHRHIGDRRSSLYRKPGMSAKERYAKDEENIQQAIRESKEMCSSSPSNKSKMSPIKMPVTPVSFTPEHMMRFPPPAGGMPPRSLNPLLMSSLFGPQIAEFDASAHDHHGFVKAAKEKLSRKHVGIPTSSPETSPSSSETSPNTFSLSAPSTTASSQIHGSAFPQMFNPAMFPFGVAPFSMPPMMPGEPTVPGAPFWTHMNLLGPGPGTFPPGPGAGFFPQCSGVPPVTVMVPFPVILPVPVPIPIPLPITKEKLEKFYAEKKASAVKNNQDTETVYGDSDRCVSSNPSLDEVSENPVIHLPQHCVAKGCLECADCQDKQRAESADLVLHIRRKRAGISVLDSTYSIKRASTPTASMEQSYSNYTTLGKKAKFEPRSDSDGAIDLSVDSTTQNREAFGKDSHVVSSSDDRMSAESHEVDSRGDPLKMTLKVPRIHIVSTVSDPPLTQQLPLPPTEHAYSLRRSLILDAPAPPKKAPSPFQERPYVRSIPRDMLEAARRRARIRTK
ncbi:sine oculis-binding protein homolog isoform X2 [Gigantopelta aegis]|uniref:sine oculis-binding protein homolog isoform X2 n=1 Tax=Gigantopelta aegis TaxID=1735272 RepID=UPI001B88CA2A|nr:sine oculis-binding protein homolog isoform X2 [Gigantopelta aegis]